MAAKWIVPCLIGVLGLVSIPAEADIQVLSQSRYVSAANDKGSIVSEASSDFGLFSATAGVSWTYTGDPLPGDPWGRVYSATAWQNSVFSTDEIACRGRADDLPPFSHYEDFWQRSVSDSQIVFAVDGPTEFRLVGELRAWGDYGGTDYGLYLATVELSNNEAGTIFSASANAALPPYSHLNIIVIDEALTLEAGVYTLAIDASAEGWNGPYTSWDGQVGPGFGGSGWADCDIRLVAIPVPAVLPLTLWGLGALVFLKNRKILP